MKNVLLVGNPNTGKTTLLNTLTKSEEHTGNWHGVTVEEKQKFFEVQGQKIGVVDLPGIYSLNALSYEEEVATNYIFSHPDEIVLNTLDINTIEKNLFLTLDLLTLGRDVVLAVNTMGEKNIEIDFSNIEKQLGVKVFVLDFENKNEVRQLKNFLNSFKKQDKKNDLNKKIFSKKTYEEIDFLAKKFNANFFEIIKIIEKNNYFIKKTDFFNKKIENNNIFFENNKNLSIEKIAEEKYFFIENLVSCKRKKRAYGDEALDKFFLNKWLAIPLFFLILIGVFYLTFFSVGAFLSDTLSGFVQGWLGGVALDFVRSFCSVPWVLGLIEDGLFAGVGSLVAFLPQVVLLFLFLAVLENTGYFSRVAFVFDDLFSSLGLSGKSVYTLLMGFGCSASAVVTARTLDSENARIKTTLMTPYMSCSAKLPVYAVLGGAFFGASNVFVVFLLYIIGVFVALFVGVMLDFFGLKNKESAFILEFPPYRFPDFKKVCKIAWLNLKLFVVKITTIFISMSVIVWCLGSFDFAFNYVAQSGGKSILQVLGEWMAPIFAPLGFGNWGAVSALIAGLVAKEVIVSSIAIFNGINSFGDASGQKLSESLMSSQSAVWFTPASALSFMSYALVYSPCLATMAIMKKEIGWKWTLIGIAIQLVVAYIVAFIVFNIFNLMEVVGVFNVVMIVFASLLVLFSVFRLLSYLKSKNKCKYCGYCEQKRKSQGVLHNR